MSGETQPPGRANRTPLLALTFILLVVTAAAIFFVFSNLLNTSEVTPGSAAIVDSDNYFDGGTVIDPPRVLNDFTLTSQDNTPISLSDLRGQVVLMYFGYTNCPDVCPITLGDFKRIKQAVGDQADEVAFVMVSVDGERDTPERLKSYISNFDPDFIGMTGDEAALNRLGADYGLFFEKQEGENYVVDHTASIFMIDPEGRLTTVYTFGTEPDVIVEDVTALLS